MIEYVDEYRIALPVHLFQFDADQLELIENFGIKEKVAGIKRAEQFLVVFPNYGSNWYISPTKSNCFPPNGSRILRL